MGQYFTPDRGDRPEAFCDETGEVRELQGELINLIDGRVCVFESAIIDGFWVANYYYFDCNGLRSANKSDLEILLKKSGAYGKHSPLGTYANIIKDNQGRDIWEFQILYDREELLPT